MESLKLSNIVIDVGSRYIKAGFSNKPLPQIIEETIVNTPSLTNMDDKCGVCECNTPYPVIKKGIINNWDAMEHIWDGISKVLKIQPAEYNFLLTESAFNDKINREKITEIFFDKFAVKGFYLKMKEVLSLYDVGKLTGIVFDSGDQVSDIVPIFDGYSLGNSKRQIELGGRDLTHNLDKLYIKIFLICRKNMEKTIELLLKI